MLFRTAGVSGADYSAARGPQDQSRAVAVAIVYFSTAA
jgi:hypothetical protein